MRPLLKSHDRSPSTTVLDLEAIYSSLTKEITMDVIKALRIDVPLERAEQGHPPITDPAKVTIGSKPVSPEEPTPPERPPTPTIIVWASKCDRCGHTSRPGYTPRPLSIPPASLRFLGAATPTAGTTPKVRLSTYANPSLKPKRECKFCKNNGESEATYSSHYLRNFKLNKLTCPVLRATVCEICGATGDDAHTRNYCPKIQKQKKFPRPLPVMLSATRRNSAGVDRCEVSSREL